LIYKRLDHRRAIETRGNIRYKKLLAIVEELTLLNRTLLKHMPARDD